MIYKYIVQFCMMENLMIFKSVKQLYFLLVNMSADRNKLLGGGIWPLSIWFLEMFCVVFWIGVYTSYESLFYITVISCKSSSLVTGVSRWFLQVNVTDCWASKVSHGTEAQVKGFVSFFSIC